MIPGQNAIINILTPFYYNILPTSSRPLRVRCNAGLEGIRIHLGRPFARGLRELGGRVGGVCPRRSVRFESLRRSLRQCCQPAVVFHSTAFLTFVAVLFVALVKLVNCVGSRIHQHDGRVTVHGVGNTRTESVLFLLSGSVF